MMKKKFLLLLPFYCATTNTMLQQGAKTFVLPIYNGAKQSLGKTISSTFSVLCPQERIIEAKIKVCLNILGLPEDATPEKIKAQYFKLAKKCHPDVNKEPGSEEKFKKINNAYEFLIGKLEELPGQGAGVSMGGGASTEEFKDDSPDKNNVKNNNKEDGEQKKQGEEKFKDNSQDKNNDKNDNPKSNRFNSKNIKNMGKGAFLAALGCGMINDDLLKRLQRKYIDENISNDILNDDNKQKKYFKDMFEDMELIILSNAQKILFFNELYTKYKDSNINKDILSNILHVKLLCEKIDLFIAQEKKSINNNMSIRDDIQQLLNGLSKDFLFTSMIEELCRKDYDNKDINLYELTLIYDITRRSKYCCL